MKEVQTNENFVLYKLLPSLSFSVSLYKPWCCLVTTAYNYFHMANFFWMFGEGCYLHTAIVLTYSTDKLKKWMFICIGWCKCPEIPSAKYKQNITTWISLYE